MWIIYPNTNIPHFCHINNYIEIIKYIKSLTLHGYNLSLLMLKLEHLQQTWPTQWLLILRVLAIKYILFPQKIFSTQQLRTFQYNVMCLEVGWIWFDDGKINGISARYCLVMVSILVSMSNWFRLLKIRFSAVYPIKYVLSFVVLCFAVDILSVMVMNGFNWSIYPYSSGLFHWHWDNHMIVPVPVK